MMPAVSAIDDLTRFIWVDAFNDLEIHYEQPTTFIAKSQPLLSTIATL